MNGGSRRTHTHTFDEIRVSNSKSCVKMNPFSVWKGCMAAPSERERRVLKETRANISNRLSRNQKQATRIVLHFFWKMTRIQEIIKFNFREINYEKSVISRVHCTSLAAIIVLIWMLTLEEAALLEFSTQGVPKISDESSIPKPLRSHFLPPKTLRSFLGNGLV